MWRKLTIGLVALALAGVAAQALPAASGDPDNPAQDGPLLQWTINGDPVGPQLEGPAVANDFHAFWAPKGRAKLRWTVDGVPVGPKLPAPSNANDVDLDWNAQTDLFTQAWWTRNGQRIQAIPIAPGANDVHVRLKPPRTFTQAFWTLNGQPIQQIPIPPGANGVDIKL